MGVKNYVILVAGGSGTRFKSEIPKQFIEINGLPILMHTIRIFHEYDRNIEIVVVLPKEHFETWKDLCLLHHFNIPHTLVFGGETRFQSVKNAIESIDNASLIAVHDGVRPCVSKETIERCFSDAIRKKASIPVVEIVDSVRKVSKNMSRVVSRNDYKIVQTPQVFEFKLLKAAYEQNYKPLFTDDASVVETYGCTISLVEGNRENIKITTQSDLMLASIYLDGSVNI